MTDVSDVSAHFVPQSYHGNVHAALPSLEAADAVRLYVSDRLGLPRSVATTVYVWGVSRPRHEIALYARRCAWVPDKSFTQGLMRELEDIAGSDVWGFTIPSPVMEPISLRAFPIDLLGMPMYHVIGLPLPRRVAVHVGPDGKLLHILQKLGISSACQASGTLCFLEVPSSDGTRFWYIDQAVDELHGTSMLLRMTVQECRPGQIARGITSLERGDENVLFQPALHQRMSVLRQDSNPMRADENFEAIVQRNLVWHELRRRIARRTVFRQFKHLRDEAIAFRASRGQLPEIVICGIIADEVSFWNLEAEGLLVSPSFVIEEVQTLLRSFVEPPVSVRSHVALAAVKPFPTVHEHDGQDDVYVLIGEDLRADDTLALVAIWDSRLDSEVDLHLVELPQRITTEALLQTLGLESRCSLPFLTCIVSHAGHELPLNSHGALFMG